MLKCSYDAYSSTTHMCGYRKNVKWLLQVVEIAVHVVLCSEF